MRMSEMTDAYVKLDKVSKIYGTKEVKIVAVDEISFEIAKVREREGDGSALPLPAAGGHGGGRELPGDLALPAAGDKGCGQ